MRISQITKKKSEQAKRGKTMKITAIALTAVLLLTMIVSNNLNKEEREQDLEKYHAEQFEKMKNHELEENYPINTQGDSQKIQEIRVEIHSNPMTLAKSHEEPVISIEKFEEELEKASEEIAHKETKGNLEVSENAEYKPIKLDGYEILADGPYEHYVYILSEEDMKYIAKLVWAEARGECYEGKVAVAATVLNRYFSEHPDFNRESILHIITQPTHFANIWNVTDWEMREDTECMEAVMDACKGWDPTREVFEEGALYFYNPDGVYGYQAEIRQNIRVMVIGAHAFHHDFEKIEG